MQNFLLIAPVLLFSIVAHEYAHGYAALLQGDDTARSLGRLTWNPLKHIDPAMTIILPIITFLGSGGRMAFGGAKPVPVNPRLYRNYRRGDIIVSLAGIATNFGIAVVMVPLIVAVGLVARVAPAVEGPAALLQRMFLYGIEVNLLLAVFNLIPILPLDGSHVLKHLLPLRLAIAYQRFGRYGIFVLMGILLLTPGIVNGWMWPATKAGEMAMRLVAPFVVPSPLGTP